MPLVWKIAITVGAFLIYSLLFGALRGVWLRSPKAPGRSRSVRDGLGDYKRIVAQMRGMAVPTLFMRPAETPAFSKIGGRPELPVDLKWPAGPNGPLDFLLQIDLAAVRSAGGPDWAPSEGLIYAFHDSRSGKSDQVRIIFAPLDPGAPLAPPQDSPRELRYPERRIEFVPRTSLPSLDWLGEDVRQIEVSDEELDRLSDLPRRGHGRGLKHRIGGYPDEIQDEQMALSCEHAARGLEYRYGQPVSDEIEQASQSWRLLLQIDSDSKLKMKWGDGGRLYVFIREQDARAGDFSQTVTITQTY